jgi:HSPB1-associated protein 1
MADLFADQPDVLRMVDWRTLGIDKDGIRSTFWFGSAGAHTACHYDTYGTNLVAQLFGEKRWRLFPPSSQGMYPTRVPYEESSVFSSVWIPQPDTAKHPLYRADDGVEVTLQPGDVLFVPRHWWHFVECLTDAITVNLWMPHPDDERERVSEAMVCPETFT